MKAHGIGVSSSSGDISSLPVDHGSIKASSELCFPSCCSMLGAAPNSCLISCSSWSISINTSKKLSTKSGRPSITSVPGISQTTISTLAAWELPFASVIRSSNSTISVIFFVVMLSPSFTFPLAFFIFSLSISLYLFTNCTLI